MLICTQPSVEQLQQSQPGAATQPSTQQSPKVPKSSTFPVNHSKQAQVFITEGRG